MNLIERAARKCAVHWPALKGIYFRRPPIIGDPVEGGAEMIRSIYPAGQRTRDLPVHLPEKLTADFHQDIICQNDGKALYRAQGALVHSASGLVALQPGGQFLIRQSWNSEEVMRMWPDYGERKFTRAEYLSGPCFLLDGLASGNYFHWLHDILSMLYGAENHLPGDCRFLTRGSLTRLQADTLGLLGIGLERVFPMRRSVYRIQELYFSPLTGKDSFDVPEVLEWLRNKFVGSRSGTRHGRRIYVSRQGGSARRIVNEADVHSVLHEFGFEEVRSEDLSFQEQVNLFHGASSVVGVHGAGLTNLIFCPHGTSVVEIHGNPVRSAKQYWSIADACGLRYGVVAGTRQGGEGNNCDLVVDPADLRAALGGILGE